MTRVPNRGSPPAVLLRESYREGGKVKTRTLANLTRWPEPKVEALSQVLKGRPPRVDVAEAFQITRSLQHGHVAAVLGTAARLEIGELIDPVRSRNRDLVLGMLAAQVIAPDSKLATARGLRSETATSSLGQVLGLGGADEDDLYAAMDWVLKRKDAIENRLAARHLTQGTLVLYDVSSAAFEGRSCPIAKIGHARDGVKGRWQIVYGLLATTAGVPVAIEVFEGNTADPKTLATQIDKLKKRFGLTRVCLVGDRGMLTSARIDSELRPAQLDWITALRAPQIKALVEADALQLSFVRRTESDRDHPPRLSRRAAGVLPQPGPGRATHPQTRRSAGGHRKRARENRRGHPPRTPPLARARDDRHAGGQGDQPLQNGQALHHRDHR